MNNEKTVKEALNSTLKNVENTNKIEKQNVQSMTKTDGTKSEIKTDLNAWDNWTLGDEFVGVFG